MKNLLLKKSENKEARMAVVGLEYVGLPLSVVFAQAGFEVIGVDLVQEKVELLNQGISYIQDIPQRF